MKKTVILTILAYWMAAVQTTAQESTLERGDNVVSLGIGLGGTLYGGRIYTGYA
jgi:hypothetical protein